jgi:hypothetical protein
MKLDQGHFHPFLEHPETNLSWPGIEPGQSASQCEHSNKELFEQLMLLLLGTYTLV